MAEETIRKLLGSVQHRELRFDRTAVKPDSRTVGLAFASEEPYKRWWGVEILDMKPGSVRMDRLKTGAALLLNHDPDQQIGVVESAQVGADKKARASVRFSRSPLGEEILQDVADGIRSKASVAYEIHAMVLEKQEGDLPTYRVTDWEPYEISLVAVPADATVGVGRAFDKEKQTNMDPENKEYLSRSARRLGEKHRSLQQLASVPAEDRKQFREHLIGLGEEEDLSEVEILRELGSVDAEYAMWRMDSIRALASKWTEYPEVTQLAARADIDSAVTYASFRQGVLQVLRNRHRPETHTGQLEQDNPGYGDAARVNQRSGPLLHFRGANAEREANVIGMYIRSLAGDQKAASWCKRTMTEGVFSTGGAMVPADMLADAVISNVEMYGVARRFAKLWPMTSATLSVPVNLEGLTIAAVGENTATPTSDLSMNQVSLTAKEFAGGVRLSRSLLDDSPIAIADFCVGEFARAVAKMEDQAVFTANGTSTYGGITGIKWRVENVAGAAGAKYQAASPHDTFAEIDLADLTAAMARLPEYARKNAKWYCSSSAKDAILTRLAAAAGGNNVQTIQGGVGEAFLGYPIITTPVLPSDTTATYNGTAIVLFGDLALTTAFGDRRKLEINIDMSRYVDFRQMYVQVVSRFDVVNHMQGVSATLCGPMVALVGKS